jgi:hypothetical protein
MWRIRQRESANLDHVIGNAEESARDAGVVARCMHRSRVHRIAAADGNVK